VLYISTAFAHIKLRNFFLWMLLGAIAVYVPLSLMPSLSDSMYTIISDTLVFFILPLLWLFYRMQHNNLQLTSFLTRPQAWNWGLILAATIMGMLFSVGISAVQFYILSYIAPNFVLDILNADGVIDDSNTFTIVYSVISAAVYAPIMEELIFRGFFLQRMTYKWGVKRAIIVSSILFGLGHSDVIGATIFGVIMCLLYIKTNSLLISIVVHALNNLIVSGIQIGSDTIYGAAEPIQLEDLQSVTDLGISIGVLVLGLFWIIPFIRRTWRHAVVHGLPSLRFINEPAEDTGLYQQVIITDKYMAVELPDEIVHRLKLEEDDYVKLEIEGDKVIITKADDGHSKIS
jgi:membrane protease YdiL (CAAX protease family)